MTEWEIFAVKYADRDNRTRRDSFIFDDAHDVQHPIDYFMWLLRSGDKTVLVDTGYDEAEGDRIKLFGHTVDPQISYADVDGDGDVESIIKVYSNQGAGGGAHNMGCHAVRHAEGLW